MSLSIESMSLHSQQEAVEWESEQVRGGAWSCDSHMIL